MGEKVKRGPALGILGMDAPLPKPQAVFHMSCGTGVMGKGFGCLTGKQKKKENKLEAAARKCCVGLSPGGASPVCKNSVK